MADFLASLNLQESIPDEVSSEVCASTEQLQSRLGNILGAKVTPTRAEHVTTALDIAATAQFTLGALDGENEPLEGPSDIDPLLRGSHADFIAGGDSEGHQTGVVNASDVLANQSQDDPALQRSVAEHILALVGNVDGSHWVVREVSRGAHGWTFTYICKDSFQHWSRQNKSQPKLLVADYTQKEQDPNLAARPAFDCRGCVIVSFMRHSRAISIKYEHTPLHRTVGELAELYKPPPPQYPEPAPEKLKTPKAPKAPKAPASTRKRRASGKAPNEGGPSRKRQKKGGKGEEQTASSRASVAAQQSLDLLGIQNASQNGNHTQAYTGDGSAVNQTLPNQDANQPSAGGALPFPINVSPEEAARRRDTATAILAEAGVNPESLSAEQFNIFSNQSPELQKESLNMLVKYGAERLRIVHPQNKENSALATTSTPSTPVPTTQATPSGPVTTNELALQSQVGGQGSAVGPADTDVQMEDGTPTRSKRGQGKSRVACSQCKTRRVKCPKQKPTCVECQAGGLACEYPAQKPKKRKSAATISAEDLQDDESELHQEAHEQEEEDEEAEAQEDSVMQDSVVYTQMPVVDMLAPSADVSDPETHDSETNYFQAHPEAVESDSELSHGQESAYAAPPSLMMPQERLYYPPPDASSASNVGTSQHRRHDELLPHSSSPKRSKNRPRTSLPEGGRGTPSMADQGRNLDNSSKNHAPDSNWGSGVNAPAQTATSKAMSSNMRHQASTGDPSHHASPEIRYNHGEPQAIALSRAALEHSQQQPGAPVTMQVRDVVSPFQGGNLPRSKSRQGNGGRAPFQSSPALDATHAPPPPPPEQQASGHTSTRHSSAAINTMPNYNSYERYSNSHATANTGSTSRITYEPYSYQRDSNNTPSYGSYSQGSNNTATTTSLPNQSMTTMTSPSDQSNNSHFNQMPVPQQSHSATSSNSTGPFAPPRQNIQSSNSEQGHSSQHNFSMRANISAPRSDKQDRGYVPYSSHAPQNQARSSQHSQQATTHNSNSGWYNFNNSDTTSYPPPSHQNTNYSWKMPDESWPGL